MPVISWSDRHYFVLTSPVIYFLPLLISVTHSDRQILIEGFNLKFQSPLNRQASFDKLHKKEYFYNVSKLLINWTILQIL